jgi:hypothetical protein
VKLLVAALVLLLATRVAAQDSVTVEVHITDPQGTPIPARVHVIDAQGHRFPPDVDESFLSHGALNGYFYTTGSFRMRIPRGATQISAGRGFEWTPQQYSVAFLHDQTFTIRLDHTLDMRAAGWFGGDTHVHTQHPPIVYDVDPADMHWVARCEDLVQSWCLDNGYAFTGTVDPVSTPDATIYYTYEYRNQSCGHVALLGLREYIGQNCCAPPNPVYPLLCQLRSNWGPAWDEGMVLAHPHNGGGFFEQEGWPGAGLGRELPVLAARGALDALDITSYTNVPRIYLEDWYRLLNCGLHVPPSSGTDNCVANYEQHPPGGYRVFVDEGAGATHDIAQWTAGLKAGRSFVSNYPLIPAFTVDGAAAGETLDYSGPSASVEVALRVESVLPLQQVRVVRNGEDAMVLPVPPPGPNAPVVVDTTLQIDLTESAWLAVRVDGISAVSHPVDPQLFAHTGPVYIDLDGEPVRRTAPAGFFLDWLDSLETFVELRDNWSSQDQHDSVTLAIQEARAYYQQLFRVAPEPFALLEPALGETLSVGPPQHFDWADAVDPEDGDRITYTLSVADDSLFSNPRTPPATEESQLDALLLLSPDTVYWWRVKATDRGGHETWATPAAAWFRTTGSDPSAITGGEETDPTPGLDAAGITLRLWPNPAPERVWMRVKLAPGEEPPRVEVVDASGRRVAGSAGTGEVRGPDRGLFCWSLRDAGGRTVPSGLYWVRVLRGEARVAAAPVLVVR